MNISKLNIATFTVILLASSAHATLKSEKVTLKGNMQVEFNKLPSSVDTISEAFTDGMFYGRLRINTFVYNWDEEIDAVQENTKDMGIGASLIYKTAPLKGISATLGAYTSQNPNFFRTDEADIELVKSGKDTFSRYKIQNGNGYGMNVLAQAYLQYDEGKTTLKMGRQMFETVFTKSNDTKMIPNTFDGVTATIKDIDKTTIELGYLAKQKLRDHTTSHDVLAYDSWNQNDDGAVNKSLTVSKIGDDNKLLVASFTNKSVKNLKTNLSYAAVPDVLSNLVFEAHYTIPVSQEWKIAPGFRYMKQMDNLGSTTDVACLQGDGKAQGYTDATSLDSNLLAIRVDLKNKAFLGRIGYSVVADEADIIAPWRGFPTAGFTRAMAQYNWYANTKTYMLRLGYDFGKADMIPGFSIMARYAIQDFDDKKDSVPADSTIIHVDARQNIGKDLELKFRLGIVKAVDDIVKVNLGGTKSDYSYNEYRVELNYFF